MRKKILVVDDNKRDARLYEELLAPHGFEIVGIQDPRAAMDAFHAFCPDMAVMDIHMPHIDGIDLIRMVRADPALWCTPVLAVTAYQSPGSDWRLRALGATAFMAKPISVANFLEAVESLVGGLVPRSV